jgi:hypothetical protein
LPGASTPIGNWQLAIWQSEMLLGLFMISVFAATATELAELKPIRRGLFILGRYVVAAFAINTLKNNIIAWHLFLLPELYLVLCS